MKYPMVTELISY